MKEKLLSALKTKFSGVNANILDRIATMLAKTVTTEDQVATAVEGVTRDFIDVMEAYGDSRANAAQQTAVQNYEQKHGLKDGKKVEKAPEQTTTTTEEGKEETPAWAKALIDSNKQLTERLNKMEGERTTSTRKTELDGIIAKLPESLRKVYSHIKLDSLSDEEFNTLKSDITSEVESISKEQGVKGAVFGRPAGNGGKPAASGGSQQEATDAEATAVVDRLNI